MITYLIYFEEIYARKNIFSVFFFFFFFFEHSLGSQNAQEVLQRKVKTVGGNFLLSDGTFMHY